MGKPKNFEHSWQGIIKRLDTGEIIHFRSELELLSLIESAVKQYRKQNEKEGLRQWSEEKKEVENGKEKETFPKPNEDKIKIRDHG